MLASFMRFRFALALVAVVFVGPFFALGSLPTTSNGGRRINADEDTMMTVANKTPKSAHLFTDACTECQTVIQKLAEVAGDPQKVMELKAVLSMLCHETSYEEECKLFVSNLDKFLDRLLPYLHDPHKVCHWMHLCGNSKIEQFHRVGLLFAKRYVNRVQGAKDLVCEECQFAAHEFQQVIDDPTYQSEAKDWLSKNVCTHMGHYQGACDTMLDELLPEFWTELHDLLKDAKQFCVDIDLCDQTTSLLQSSSGSTPSSSSTPSTPSQNAQSPSGATTATDQQQHRRHHHHHHQKVSKRVIATIFPDEEPTQVNQEEEE